MKDSVYNELWQIMFEQRIIDKDDSIRGMKLLSAGGVMDSLTSLRFIAAVEARFGVDIREDLNLTCMETADKLVAYIIANTVEPPLHT